MIFILKELKETSIYNKYEQIIESIIQNENLLLKSEDELLLFILKLCEIDYQFEILFEYVFLEYCSTESIQEFLSYLKKAHFDNQQEQNILKCLSRRLLQKNLPLSIVNNKNRYINQYKEYKYDENNPFNGILRQEYLNDNVKMRTSGTHTGKIYDLIRNDINSYFITTDEPNSWIKGKLKNKQPFIITKYAIRGNKYDHTCHHLKSWKLEGKRISDGKWILLDNHENEPFNTLLIRSYSINNNEKLCAVRLTTAQLNQSGDYHLAINAFDIYGKVYLY